METPARQLIDRYARRMVIGNIIADAIDFFHMDALSAAVPMKVDLDLQLTLMASTLYRILPVRVGGGHEMAKAHTLFRGFVNASANITITESEIIVTMERRANNPLLLAAETAERREPNPWLGNRILTSSASSEGGTGRANDVKTCHSDSMPWKSRLEGEHWLWPWAALPVEPVVAMMTDVGMQRFGSKQTVNVLRHHSLDRF